MPRPLIFAATLFSAMVGLSSRAQADVVVYDGLSAGTNPTFTGSTPRTYMGQAFSVADPGTAISLTSMRITLVVGGAANFAATQLRIQFWNVFDPAATGTANPFSSPATLQVFNTGAINVAGATAFTFTLTFATPISLAGLTNHGLTVNWESDAAGTGTFIDNNLLTTALRTGAGGTVPPPALTAGSNLNPSGGYFRNASGLTNLNFQANDARSIANVGGLMFELSAVAAVPEPSTFAAAFLSVSTVGAFFFRRRRN